MINRVRDGGRGAHDPDLAFALRPQRVDMRIVVLNPYPLDAADIGVGGDVIPGEITAGRGCSVRVTALKPSRHSPTSCERAIFGLMIRPGAKHA